ncbi:MAG TPA: TlpA disulfide reductase family protein [Pseudobdellovibrionaceae bacterium]|nr:TlpA disulfide reductase family protein [Pseudobdellovibrionaceae bacterium]
MLRSLIVFLFAMMTFAPPLVASANPTSFALKNLPSKKLRGDIPDLSKANLILIDFWASWCTPCLASLPFYDELQKKYQDRGVVFLSLSEDDSVEDAEKLLKKVHFSFPALWDEGRKVANQLKIESIPVLVVLDRTGKIISVERGFTEKKKKALPGQIEVWLKTVTPKK